MEESTVKSWKYDVSLFGLDSVEEKVTLRDIARGLELAPIKNDTDEFQFSKKYLGCEMALALYGNHKIEAEFAKQQLLTEILMQKKKLSSSEWGAFIREIKVAVALHKLELRGIPINLSLLQQACADALTEYCKAYSELEMAVGESEEKLTPQMVRSVLSSFSSDSLNSELAKVKKMWKRSCLLDFTKLSEKIQEKHGEHRIFCCWQNYAAVSGRIQSTNPNIQGLPKDVRKNCFVPPKGKALIIADYKSAELAIMAVLANDKQMLRDIEADVDFHTKIAAKLLKKADSYVTEDERKLAKRLTFACLYGAADTTLQDMFRAADVSNNLISGKIIRSVIKGTYPAITLLEAKIKHDKKLQFLDGTAVSLKSIKKHCVVNRLVQGTGAILLKSVLLKLETVLPAGAEVVCLIHDEIVVETPLEILQESYERTHDAMANILKDYKICYRLPVSMEVRKELL